MNPQMGMQSFPRALVASDLFRRLQLLFPVSALLFMLILPARAASFSCPSPIQDPLGDIFSARERLDREYSRPLILLFIDFNDFMCPACLDAFLSLCRLIPQPYLQQNVWGLVVLPSFDQIQARPMTVKIMEKKIRGFRKANRIEFPLVLDKARLFKGMARTGSCVIVFDAPNLSIIRIPLPLSHESLAGILSLFIEAPRPIPIP